MVSRLTFLPPSFFSSICRCMKPRQDVEEALPLQHLFPQVGGLVAAGIVGIAGAACRALVEGQKARVPPRQARGHVDLVRIDGEVDQRPLLELEDQVRGVAIVLVLGHGVPPGLAGHGILELHGGHRDAVQAQDHVEGIAVPGWRSGPGA